MSTPGVALVTGVSGQDGWYLAQRLLTAGWAVHGTVRDPAQEAAMAAELPGVVVHRADLLDEAGLCRVVDLAEPDVIYNLAGSTSVAQSWSQPVEAAEVLGLGAIRLLHAGWGLQERLGRPVRFVQASSAEIFGDPADLPQSETTPHRPVTPYGAAKAFAHSMVHAYRNRGMFAAAAILYNHESPRRPPTFVARKISRAVAGIAEGSGQRLSLGNIDAVRDWGYAPDYVEALMVIAGADAPDDFIVATGAAHSVRDFVQEAFASVGIVDWAAHVDIDPTLIRPADPHALVGDSTRLRQLGWTPSVSFAELVRVMVEADRALLISEANHG